MGLDYDNSAFYYFGLTMLGLYVMPSTLWAVYYLFCELFAVGQSWEKIYVRQVPLFLHNISGKRLDLVRLHSVCIKLITCLCSTRDEESACIEGTSFCMETIGQHKVYAKLVIPHFRVGCFIYPNSSVVRSQFEARR